MLMQTETPPKIIANEKVTARKSHWCSWCGKIIPAGTEYRRISLKTNPSDDSTFKCEKVCLEHFR